MSAETLEELRRAFDATFAARRPLPAELVDLVAVRAGGLSCAVRVAEIGGVAPYRCVASLPSEEPSLLGIAAVRGEVLPVYDLAALAGSGVAGAPRWMLLSRGAERVALAFDAIEEYLRVARTAFVAAPPPEPEAKPVAAEFVRGPSSLRPVVSVSALLHTIEGWLGLPRKER